MPKPTNRSETVDLHAPWWSADKDASGRFVERWVVRKDMSEHDEQAVSDALSSKLRLLTNGRNSKQLGDALMQQIIQTQMAYARVARLLQMTVEVTDETGTAYHLNKDFLSSLPTSDTAYISEEMDTLYGKPDVEVLPEDEEFAAQMRDAAEQGAPVDEATLTPEGRAAQRFRGAGKVTQLRG